MQTLRKTCKYKSSTVQLYSSKMMPTSQKLTDVGKETDNEMLTVLLLHSLTHWRPTAVNTAHPRWTGHLNSQPDL